MTGAGTTAAGTTAEAAPSEGTKEPPRQPARHGRSRQTSKEEGGGAEGGGSERAASPGPRRAVPVAPLKVPGGGSAQFKVSGGDNSVQEYGEEAGESELRLVAEAVHAFLVARVRREWGRACALLAASERKSLEKLAASSPQLEGKGCPAALDAMTKAVSPSLARELTTVNAASLRHEGEQAFLVYTGPPGRTVYAMPLKLEGGAWRLGAISGAELPGT